MTKTKVQAVRPRRGPPSGSHRHNPSNISTTATSPQFRRWARRRGRSPTASFATFLIVGPACFFLGILFSFLPYDYYVLWSVPSFPLSEAFNTLEQHLQFLHASPSLVPRMLNFMIGLGLVGLFIKLYKPKDTNMLFDGASLVLYVVTLLVYLSNFIKGIRVISSGDYGFAGADYISREDRLRVMAVSNTIMALLMVGVLVLQAGQWYAARSEEDELNLMDFGPPSAPPMNDEDDEKSGSEESDQ